MIQLLAIGNSFTEDALYYLHGILQAKGVVIFEEIVTESGKNIQDGFMQIFAGSIQGIRNPESHENKVLSANEAIKCLILASLLMDKIDDALINTGINE